MRRIFVTVLTVLVLTSVMPAWGQEPAWEVHLLENSTGRILTVTPEGLSTLAEFPTISEFSVINEAAISPDGAYLVFAGFRTEGTGIYVANLQAGTCCTKLPDIIPTGADFVVLGDFNPEGTKVAAVHSRINIASENESRTGFVVTYDLASAMLDSFISTTAFSGESPPLLGAYLGEWFEQGIEVFATCMACDRPTQGVFSVWNPEDDSIVPDIGLFLGGGRQMRATGEIVMAIRDETYPIGQGLLGNVIQYFPGSGAGQEPFVIYHDANRLLISSVNWIHNGDNLLVAHAGEDIAVVLGRDGSRTELAIPRQNQFLATTPGGWLARNETDLFMYAFQDGQLAENALGNVQGTLILLGGTQITPQAVTPFPQQAP